jgi:hypothetical protein
VPEKRLPLGGGFQAQAQSGFPACRQFPDLIGKISRGAENFAAFFQQQPATGCEHRASPLALKQGDSQLFFQFLHGVGQGGSGLRQFLGGPGETAASFDRIQRLQCVQCDGGLVHGLLLKPRQYYCSNI